MKFFKKSLLLIWGYSVSAQMEMAEYFTGINGKCMMKFDSNNGCGKNNQLSDGGDIVFQGTVSTIFI